MFYINRVTFTLMMDRSFEKLHVELCLDMLCEARVKQKVRGLHPEKEKTQGGVGAV